uniref:ubiquitinyl hydrolase 1 n=1 Tax=Anopheles minimus TaxID=112268 RepID=A0A182W866_9DIPT
MNMETTHLVTEFITHTGANTQDAVSCLKSWEWDLKKALIDYNDTSTTEYFNNKKNENEDLMKAHSSASTSTTHLYGSASTSSMLPSATTRSMLSSGTFSKNQRQPQPLHMQHIHDSQYPYVTNGSVIGSKNGTFGESIRISNSSSNNITSVQMQSLSAVKSHRNPQYSHFNNSGSASTEISMVGNVNPGSSSSSSNSGMNYTSVLQTPIVHLKPMLKKADSIDIFDSKKLERGISRATENVTLVSRARQEFEMDFHAHIHEQNDKNLNFIDTPDYTFTLPDLTKYTDDFRKFLEKDLIENSTLNSLETTNRLNWWYESGACRKLWPLATTGDGNCLLHAASLAMWGFHDRRLTLRRTLHDILSKEEFREALYRRWRFQQTRVNKQAGFVFCESEWAKEWEEIVAIASPEPRRNSKSTGPSRRRSLLIEKSFDALTGGTSSTLASDREDENATYESLEEIHVLALAHILRRTIIVVSDVFLRDINGEAFSPIPFGGVYLPFEVPSNECHRAPLLLAYDMAHFSALVAMEASNDSPPALIPLVDETNQLLPIQFCIDPGKDFNWREYDGSDGNWILTDREHIALLKEYLDIVHATGIESPDDEIYYDDYSDDEYEKKISEGEITFASDENYNHNVGTTPMSAVSATASSTTTTTPIGGVTIASMTASNQSLPASSSGKDAGGKSKAAKQLQSVAKQFGSIGKSMSRKLRKNIGSITRIGSKNSHSGSSVGGVNGKKSHFNDKSNYRSEYPRFRILCAQLKSRRHEYQEEMIRNYLECAQERYLEAEKMRDRKEIERLTKYVAEVGQLHRDHELEYGGEGNVTELPEVDGGGPVNCINAGCLNYGTAATSYMCLECYEMQCKRETSSTKCNIDTTDYTLRYGTGKSKFYAEADMDAHDRIQKLPSARRLNDLDQTLYLSRSTFYNDTKPDDIHLLAASAYKQGGLEQSSNATGLVRQNSQPQQLQHHHHHHHHQQQQHQQSHYHRGEELSKASHLQQHQQQHPTTATCMEYSLSAKPPTGPSSSGSTTSSSSGIVAAVYSPGGSGHSGSHSSNIPYTRAGALCVVNLPPVSSSVDTTGAGAVGQFVSCHNGTASTAAYGAAAGANEAIRSLHPFSSSSSSSSIGVAVGAGNGGLQSSQPIVNSSHYGKNQLCRTEGCKFYGSINTNFYCSKCCQEYNI